MLMLFTKTNNAFANKFKTCRDFTKYPDFKDDIKKDYWISRIIKEHYLILVSLSDFLPEEEKARLNEYMDRIDKRPFIKYLCSE